MKERAPTIPTNANKYQCSPGLLIFEPFSMRKGWWCQLFKEEAAFVGRLRRNEVRLSGVCCFLVCWKRFVSQHLRLAVALGAEMHPSVLDDDGLSGFQKMNLVVLLAAMTRQDEIRTQFVLLDIGNRKVRIEYRPHGGNHTPLLGRPGFLAFAENAHSTHFI